MAGQLRTAEVCELRAECKPCADVLQVLERYSGAIVYEVHAAHRAAHCRVRPPVLILPIAEHLPAHHLPKNKKNRRIREHYKLDISKV